MEISTRKAADRGEREADLREALQFARAHLAFGAEASPHPAGGARA